MTNKLEQDKQIIADAPEGATHFDGGVWVQSTGKQPFEKWNDRDWDYEDAYEMDNIRSLDDIRENIALQERVAELEKLNKTLETLMKSGERRGVEKATEELSQTLTQKDKKIAELEARIKELEQAQPKWMDIESIPEDLFVDVWVSSSGNKDWGLRVINVCKTKKHSKGWVGLESQYLTEAIKPTHWMPQPQPPEVK